MSLLPELNQTPDTDDELNYIQRDRDRRAILDDRQREQKPRLTKIADQNRTRFRSAATASVAPTGFNPTFKGKQFEENWLLESLGGFYDEHLIADILAQVKGGKEANVYCCLAHATLGPSWVAAKVFRPRMFRNLKNDAAYRAGGDLIGADGKAMRKQREQRAVAGRTGIGLEMLHQSWLSNEFAVLSKLHAAGALTPKPYGVNANAILMEYMGEPGMAAPTLNHVILGEDEGRTLFHRVIAQIRLMLRCEIIHGDLSAYNILYWKGEIRIIDFPQAVNPWRNPHAYRFFTRDVTRVTDYFAGYGIAARPEALARALWREVFGPEAGEKLAAG